MKIQLRNFGPIEFFEFDTKTQMHFIFGENNIGKSYAISAVYLLLKNLTQSAVNHNGAIYVTQENIENIEKIVQNNIESNDSIDVSEKLKKIYFKTFNTIFLKNINNSFATSFDSIENLSNRYSNKELSIHLLLNYVELIIGVSKGNILELKDVKINLEAKVDIIDYDRQGFSLSSESNKKVLQFHFNKKNQSIKSLRDGLNLFSIELFSEIRNEAGNVYFLPASRSGLYNALSAFGAIFAELSQKRTTLSSKIELPNLTEPVSDYFLNLSSIKVNGTSSDDLLSIAAKIEQNLLKGEVSFNSKNKKLFYSPSNLSLNLDLPFASSMISEIAPIVAHLKYIIKQNDELISEGSSLLFIEEPEAHLHPKVQIELMKIFVHLSELGVNVIVTSHSNYLFNKLSNQILAKEIDSKKVAVYHFKMGKNGSYVDKDSMKVDIEGIEDANFSDVAEELYSERLELYENLEF